MMMRSGIKSVIFQLSGFVDSICFFCFFLERNERFPTEQKEDTANSLELRSLTLMHQGQNFNSSQ